MDFSEILLESYFTPQRLEEAERIAAKLEETREEFESWEE